MLSGPGDYRNRDACLIYATYSPCCLDRDVNLHALKKRFGPWNPESPRFERILEPLIVSDLLKTLTSQSTLDPLWSLRPRAFTPLDHDVFYPCNLWILERYTL